MLNLFRRHVSECPNYGKRMGQESPRKPPCPIHYEGMGGNGMRVRSGADRPSNRQWRSRLVQSL